MLRKFLRRATGLGKGAQSMARRSESMTVADYYSANVVSVDRDATIEQAIRAMVAKKSNSVVVVDAAKRIKGIFSLQDAVSLMVPDSYENVESLVAFSSPDMLGEELAKIKDKKVSICMSTKVLTLKPTDSVSKAVSILALRKVRQAPVVDADGTLLGYISRGHIKRAIIDLLE